MRWLQGRELGWGDLSVGQTVMTNTGYVVKIVVINRRSGELCGRDGDSGTPAGLYLFNSKSVLFEALRRVP